MSGFSDFVLAAGKSSPAAWGRGLRLALLILVLVLGHRAGGVPAWMSLARPTGAETNRPIESETPVDPSDSFAEGGFLDHGHRPVRSRRGDLARGKLPPSYLASHFVHGHSFVMAESCFGSEHALRNGSGSHLRC